MKNYIIGNGGFAKEILFLLKEVYGPSVDFGGFIDFQPKHNEIVCLGQKFPVLDEDEFLKSWNKDCNLFLGIGEPRLIQKIVNKFGEFNFPNLIHPSVVGHFDSIRIGSGNIITAGCVLTVDISIGSYNIFNLNTTIGHDTTIGNFNVFNPGSHISGSLNISNSILFGTNSAVLQGLKIGSKSIIGAGSLVNKNVEENTVVVGVPARAIKTID
jgi:sugar O-acyltransferase (sialic acid O-acetyltransferase NeuD family)